MTDLILVASAVAFGLFVACIALTVVDWRQQRRHDGNLEAAVEAERRWPFLAIEDFTEDDELAPFVSAPIPPPVRVHVECLDAWADGTRPCGRCETILGVHL